MAESYTFAVFFEFELIFTINSNRSKRAKRSHTVPGCLDRRLPNLLIVNTPKKARVKPINATTIRVKPAPRTPAPAGLILGRAAASPCSVARARAAQPLSWLLAQTLHQAAVVFIAIGWQKYQYEASLEQSPRLTAIASMKADNGTSPVRLRKLYVTKSASLPFLKLKRMTGSPPSEG
jgi:hypothetical protein